MRGFTSDVFKSNRVFILKISSVLCLAIISLLFYTHNVFADQFSWITDTQPIVESSTKTPSLPTSCVTTATKIKGVTDPRNVCLSSHGNFKFGLYYDSGSIYKGAVSFGFDKQLYPVDGMCGGYYKDCYYIPDQDIMISRYYYSGSTFKTGSALFKDFSTKLSQVKDSFGKVTHYNFPLDSTTPDFVIGNVPTASYSFSDNGQWIVVQAQHPGIVRINTDNFSALKFTNQHHSYGSGYDSLMELSISDNGQWAAVAGRNTTERIYQINEGSCGKVVVTADDIKDTNYTQCPSKYIPDTLGDKTNGLMLITQPKLSDDGGRLSLYLGYHDDTKNAVVNLLAPGYIAPRLDYLALGDSYSSGEGDTATTSTSQKYYLANTDENGDYVKGIPREKCHQSWRAWPFLLADYYQIPEGKFETVACSGAQIGDISAVGTYEGQARGGSTNGNKARLEGLSNTIQLQREALEEFNPGRVRQLNFVNKYKPEAITIGIGGNDVGFSKKIEACVHPISGRGTCDWTNIKRATLGNQIRAQFDKLVILYTKVKSISSPQTKIYAIGYPQFITDTDPAACGLNVGAANKEEREMIVQSTNYMNQIIQAAATNVGVQYISIDDALNGGMLCEDGQEFVTGISDYGNQESYHPNSHGNWKITQKIKQFFGDNNLRNYSTYPSGGDTDIVAPTTVYFSEAMADAEIKNSQNVQMSNEVVSKNTQHFQKIDSYMLKPNSIVTRQLHSDPINLGDIAVNEDGSLDTTFVIPNNISVGYHTIIIKGESYSGEPIELTQTVLVTSDNPNDLDENNIPDQDQACGAFLEASGQDKDFDEIDDACDPEISDVQPYRVRNGNSQKNENPEHMYIERNIHASSVTGISGDYDPDNDNWAIVAQSNKPINSGTPSHFWIDDNNKVPHVSIRTNDRGCVQFTPRSLKVVKLNKIRKLKLEAKNTNTCRSEPVNADVDNNDIADNQQVLYRAHNGISTNEEDPNSIYLERSSIASEAQLGLSDYPYGSLWNLLASSQNDTTKANFVKLVMVTDENGKSLPIILANQTKTSNKGKVTTTCIALQPQNTNVITINNQDIKLKKVTVPQGENCE